MFPIPTRRRRLFLFALRCSILLRYLVPYYLEMFRAGRKKAAAKMRAVFGRHRNGSFSYILALWGLGCGVGIAAYQPPIPEDIFYLAYFLVLVAGIWLLGNWWSSEFLLIKRHNSLKAYRRWLTIGIVVIFVFTAYPIQRIRQIQIGRDLLSLNGVLIPADEPDPEIACLGKLRDSAIYIILGALVVSTTSPHLTAIATMKPGTTRPDKPILAIDRLPGNQVAITLHVLDDEMKEMVDIDQNKFEINRNQIFDSLSPPRPDKSTLRVKDQHGNILTVRLINKRTVLFTGDLFYVPGKKMSVTFDGIEGGNTAFVIDHSKSKAYGPCFEYNNPNGGALFGVPER